MTLFLASFMQQNKSLGLFLLTLHKTIFQTYPIIAAFDVHSYDV